MAFNSAHHFTVENIYAVDNSRRGVESGLNLLLKSACLAAGHQSDERYDPPKCSPGTRLAVIDEIMSWVDSGNPEGRMKWLSGPAGSGKSSIAQTIAEKCEAEGKLVSSFFFSRTSARTGADDTKRLVPTIAYHLLNAIPEARPFILACIEENPGVLESSMKVQLQKLVMEPLQYAVEQNQRRIPAVVVIDGLDECRDDGAQVAIINALAWLASQSSAVHLRLLVASRPELEIRNTFNLRSVREICTRLVLDDQYAPDRDIEIYLRGEFLKIKEEHTLASIISHESYSWPRNEDIWELAKKSSGQFIYAATVIKYIGDIRHDPRVRLREVIDIQPTAIFKESPYAELDAVYTRILNIASAKSQGYHSISHIFMAMLYLNPELDWLSVVTVARLTLFLGLQPFEIPLMLADLHSVMHIPDTDDLITFTHASFSDFLMDASRSRKYFISREKAQIVLTKHCFKLLASDVSRGYDMSDSDIVLQYAVHSYFYHLSQGEFDEELLKDLRTVSGTEAVRGAISSFSNQDIGRLIMSMYSFSFSERTGIFILAKGIPSEVGDHISNGIDEAIRSNHSSTSGITIALKFRFIAYAISSFKLSMVDSAARKDKEFVYRCWMAVMLETPERAREHYLSNEKCEVLIRAFGVVYKKARAFNLDEIRDYEILLEYLLDRIEPSLELGIFIREQHSIYQWKDEMLTPWFNWTAIWTPLKSTIDKYLKACDTLQSHHNDIVTTTQFR